MDLSPETIFISYARSDGRDFAEAFERRLAGAGIRSWRDIKDMASGEILPQVLRAIESAKHLVLILSRRALTSDWIKREWSHARMVGKKVSPVLADSTIKRSDLPPWIRREEIFEIAEPERWTQLVRILQSPGYVRRAPYMPGTLRDGFVPRPVEYGTLKIAVLAAGTDKAVALTTALSGAGGYGKTLLANYLCRDDDVRFEFTDGIIRVEVGKERADVTGLVIDLIEMLDPGGKRPGFQDVTTASEYLGAVIGEARVLLVIDDVWREAQLRPFLRGGPNCVRLVTTRLLHVLPRGHVPILIDQMRTAEAASLITMNLPVDVNPATRARLAALADCLGNWAQMLSIANGWIRQRTATGENLADALARFERRLAIRGLAGFDPQNEKERNRAIRNCVEASLEDLSVSDSARFSELSVLPEDEDVPLHIVEALWAETGNFDEDETDDLVQRLHSLSLFQNLDLGARTLRLHDNMLWYLRDRIGPEGYHAAHTAMVRAIGAACGSVWDRLPVTHRYGWSFLIHHLRAAGQDEKADKLLTDYGWIRAKLHATDARALFASYLPESNSEAVRKVDRAIALSLPALTDNPRELPRQIFGRLGRIKQDRIAALITLARADPDFRPAPRWPGLTPPGMERLRLRHKDEVRSAAFSPDGTRIVTASDDGTARVWDAASGAEIAALSGHEGEVASAVFSPEGARIVTASNDGTARVWDAASGAEIAALRGHEGEVASAVFFPEGARIVTASNDGTARVWDAASGAEVATLHGHEEKVWSAVFSPEGARIVTASDDGTARVWDAASGTEVATLHGHEEEVWSAVFSPEGARIVTASDDGTARVWDAASGTEIATLHDPKGGMLSAAFSPDGTRIVTTSFDHKARVWDAASGAEIAALRGHVGAVLSAAFSPDGTRIVTASNDGTARVWNTASGAEIATLRGHEEGVRSAAFSPDGTRIVTASWGDRTARVWDAASSAKIAALRDHAGAVQSTTFSPDGTRIVTVSEDGTARVWDAANGTEIARLRGYKRKVQSAAFSPDGTRIVTASNDHTARVWDAISGAEIGPLCGHEHAVRSAAFSPDGTRIVTASDDTAWVWDAASGAEIAALHGHEERVRSAAFSPDGTRIVTASHDHTARVWDAASGAEIATLRGHEEEVRRAAFSPDGTRIGTTSDDGTARTWDAVSGAEIATLRGHKFWVQSAAFSPDGTRIVTASSDYTARVWDAVSGAETAALRGHEEFLHGLAFSPNGTRIVTASNDRTTRVWDAASGAEVARFALDGGVTALNIHGSNVVLGDALGRIHVFEAGKLLSVDDPSHG